jgi:hypothetical protein
MREKNAYSVLVGIVEGSPTIWCEDNIKIILKLWLILLRWWWVLLYVKINFRLLYISGYSLAL